MDGNVSLRPFGIELAKEGAFAYQEDGVYILVDALVPHRRVIGGDTVVD